MHKWREYWLAFLIIYNCDGPLHPKLYPGIEAVRRAVSPCQIRAGAFDRRLCDRMRNAPGARTKYVSTIAKIHSGRKIVLGEHEIDVGAI
jgi:hypothetical protein